MRRPTQHRLLSPGYELNRQPLLYSSYLGGGKDDYAHDLALDGQGEAYLTGETYSADFPTTPGTYEVALEGTKRDAFVVKVSQRSTQEQQTRVIHYTYDPLLRLTAAGYDDGTYFHYTYDSEGNRLSETTQLGTTTYPYDIANRLTG